MRLMRFRSKQTNSNSRQKGEKKRDCSESSPNNKKYPLRKWLDAVVERSVAEQPFHCNVTSHVVATRADGLFDDVVVVSSWKMSTSVESVSLAAAAGLSSTMWRFSEDLHVARRFASAAAVRVYPGNHYNHHHAHHHHHRSLPLLYGGSSSGFIRQ